ncbi:M15 family metallopeptidase, partial [Candidatus Sumerlaeota bacterium]|nr:M15 family metallopeptidase [Candidatus Sumerlaeota bacterium]
PLDYEPSDLVDIPARFVARDDRTLQLRREACDALVRMLGAALADDVDIQVNSAYRSGSRQEQIYRRNVRRNPGQRSSARPGHSEHQLGTTVDLTDPPGEYGFSQEFVDTPQGQWLEQHAHEFGFRRTYYPENDEETGYIPEPWHWRYMGDALSR